MSDPNKKPRPKFIYKTDPKEVRSAARFAERLSHLVERLELQYGGDFDEEQHGLIRRIATMTIESERIEDKRKRGVAIDIDKYGVLVDRLNRAYARLESKLATDEKRDERSQKFEEWLGTLTPEELRFAHIASYALVDPQEPPPPRTKPYGYDPMRKLTHPEAIERPVAEVLADPEPDLDELITRLF